MEDHILALMIKKLINEASELQLMELGELLKQHPDTRARVTIITEWWQLDQQSPETTSQHRFQKILERIKDNDVKQGNKLLM